jgi:hypothetical protein
MRAVKGNLGHSLKKRWKAREGIHLTPRSGGLIRAIPETIYTSKLGRIIFGSLAAAALDGHFEHPASRSCNITIHKITVSVEQKSMCQS